jgi:acyl-CoA thioester hydrolase
MENGVTPVLVSTEIHYKKSIRLFDRPRAKMWLSDLSQATLTIDAEIYLDDVLATQARHVGVFVDIARMKPIRVPKLFRETVEKYASTASI